MQGDRVRLDAPIRRGPSAGIAEMEPPLGGEPRSGFCWGVGGSDSVVGRWDVCAGYTAPGGSGISP